MAEYKPASAAAITRLTMKLRARWPAAYCEPPKPLALGISRDIVSALYPRDWSLMGYAFFSYTRPGVTLRDTMHAWTHDPRYLAACSRGAARINLDGVPVGTVSDADAVWAASEYQRLQNIRRPQLRLISSD
jgi:sRNA-binding protein